MIKIEAVLKAAFEILDHFQRNRELKIDESTSENCIERRCAAEDQIRKVSHNQEDQQANLFKLYQD